MSLAACQECSLVRIRLPPIRSNRVAINFAGREAITRARSKNDFRIFRWAYAHVRLTRHASDGSAGGMISIGHQPRIDLAVRLSSILPFRAGLSIIAGGREGKLFVNVPPFFSATFDFRHGHRSCFRAGRISGKRENSISIRTYVTRAGHTQREREKQVSEESRDNERALGNHVTIAIRPDPHRVTALWQLYRTSG